jgi:hypothetical protein
MQTKIRIRQFLIGSGLWYPLNLINDARYFDGTNDYPNLDDLLRVVREDGSYSAEVSTDIIRLVPRVVS